MGKSKKRAVAPKHCEIPECGYSKITQRHRIVPGRDGGKYVLGNVIALCPNHHAEADKGLDEPDVKSWLHKSHLLKIVKERIARDAAAESTEGTGTTQE